MSDKNQLQHHDHKQSDRLYRLSLLAHNLQTPQNIGSLFRMADALGLEHLYLTGSSVTPPNNKIRKTSRATEKSVPFSCHADPVSLIQQLKQDGYQIISLELTSTSIDLQQLELKPVDRICLVIGSEKHGVVDELLALSDVTVHIPMHGQNSSMNVAMAAAIASYEITRQPGIKKKR